MEVILEYAINVIADNKEIALILATTLLEFSPLKINPWKSLGRWLGNILVGDLKEEFRVLKKDFEESRANNMRWNILNFARSCRQGEDHTEEEWNYAIAQLRMYEEYMVEKKMKNGVVEDTAVYLRELYHNRLHKNDFAS